MSTGGTGASGGEGGSASGGTSGSEGGSVSEGGTGGSPKACEGGDCGVGICCVSVVDNQSVAQCQSRKTDCQGLVLCETQADCQNKEVCCPQGFCGGCD